MRERPMEQRTKPPIRFLRLPEVQGRTGLSRSTIYVRLSEGRFPRPVSLGARRGLDRGRGGQVDPGADRGKPVRGRSDRRVRGGRDLRGASAGGQGRSGSVSRARSQQPKTSLPAASKAGEPAHAMLNIAIWRGDAAPPFEPPASCAAPGQRAGGGAAPRTPSPVRSWLTAAPPPRSAALDVLPARDPWSGAPDRHRAPRARAGSARTPATYGRGGLHMEASLSVCMHPICLMCTCRSAPTLADPRPRSASKELSQTPCREALDSPRRCG